VLLFVGVDKSLVVGRVETREVHDTRFFVDELFHWQRLANLRIQQSLGGKRVFEWHLLGGLGEIVFLPEHGGTHLSAHIEELGSLDLSGGNGRQVLEGFIASLGGELGFYFEIKFGRSLCVLGNDSLQRRCFFQNLGLIVRLSKVLVLLLD